MRVYYNFVDKTFSFTPVLSSLDFLTEIVSYQTLTDHKSY